jgi:hypothetical protein
MRLFSRFSKGLLGAGLVASALFSMSGCGPDYAVYRVDITSIDSSNRSDIAQCRITITANDSPKPALDHYLLNDCAGLTTSKIGTFSYSSSRSSGSLNFIVESYDANGYDPTDRTNHRLQWNENDKPGPIAVKAYNGPADEIPVSIAISKH